MEILKSLVRDGAMLCAVPLSIWAEIPSGPLAFDGSRDIMRKITSSVVQRSSLGMDWNARWDGHDVLCKKAWTNQWSCMWSGNEATSTLCAAELICIDSIVSKSPKLPLCSYSHMICKISYIHGYIQQHNALTTKWHGIIFTLTPVLYRHLADSYTIGQQVPLSVPLVLFYMLLAI